MMKIAHFVCFVIFSLLSAAVNFNDLALIGNGRAQETMINMLYDIALVLQMPFIAALAFWLIPFFLAATFAYLVFRSDSSPRGR